jgi:hypothetical protein
LWGINIRKRVIIQCVGDVGKLSQAKTPKNTKKMKEG